MNATNFDPGCVEVHLAWRAGRVVDATVRLTRPDLAARLRGRPARDVVELLPLLYSVCGRAQGAAARLAWRAAQGEASAPRVDNAALAEARRERLMRLLLDWPRALGVATREDLLAAGVHLAATDEFAPWAATQLAAQADALRALAGDDEGLLPMFADELGLAWGEPALAGVGRSYVETARGRLEHEVSVRDGCVEHYRVVAPTDRHFAPGGPASLRLNALAASSPDALRLAAERTVLALDPCVRWTITVDA